MPIYKPSELHAFLNGLGIHPKKGLSQNFLIDGNIIRKIVTVSAIEPKETILEIGPGPGSLTQALLNAQANVIAVEKDPILAHALERLQTPTQQLTFFCNDIMQFQMEQEITARISAEKRAKIIANLPYHLTTPILAECVPLRHLFSSLTVMVQEEVARRFTAQPGTPEYGSFTIFLRFYTTPHYAFRVSKNCFYPVPKVDSAIVILELKDPPLDEKNAKTFFQLTRTAFKQRRKMMRASLKDIFPPEQIENALTSIGLSPLARPETLSLENFLQLHAILYQG